MKINKPVIETVPLAKLKEWSKNPRKKHAVGAIGSSMEQFGYVTPIIVQKGTYRVLAGHGRLKALREKGVVEVPVIVADLTERQADAFTVADNKLTDMSAWDYNGLGEIFRGMDDDMRKLTGFTDGELNELLAPPAPAEAEGDTSVNTTLFVNFGSRAQLKRVKAEIVRLQAGNEKTIGEVIYERFFPDGGLK